MNIKQILLTVVFTLCMGCVWAQANAPQIKFDTLEYDFGKVPHKSSQVKCEFAFTNTGSAPLVIIKATTSCTCTKVEFPKKPVMPGTKASLTVIYEPIKKEPGVFYKAIDIYANTPEKRHTIVVKGNAVD